MKIPAPPPLYASPGNVVTDGQHGRSSNQDDSSINNNNLHAYQRYYSQDSQNSSSSISSAHHHLNDNNESAAVPHHVDQQQALGQQYYDYYRTSQTVYDHQKGGTEDDMQEEQEGNDSKNSLADDQDGGYGYGRNYSSTSDNNSVPHINRDATHAAAPAAQAAAASPRTQMKLQYNYYGNNNNTQSIYDPSYDQQQTNQVEEQHDHSYLNQLEQAHHEGLNEEAVVDDVVPSTPSSTMKEKLLPNMFSLAQKLLPTVMKRLDQIDNNYPGVYDDDDFDGTCSPLGSPTTSPRKQQAFHFPRCKNPTTPDDGNNNNNLKTTGLEETDYYRNESYYDEDDVEGSAVDDVEAGADDPMGTDDPMAAATEYLPQSAALLVSALQGSAKKMNKYNDNNDGEGISRMSFGNLPSLMDEAAAAVAANAAAEGSAVRHGGLAGSPPIKRLDSLEREAEALLDSIRKDELDSRGRRRFKRGYSSGSRRSGSLENGSQENGSSGAKSSAVAAIGGSSSTFDDDDEGSIGGDMERLTRSIAYLQRDLNNVDFEDVFNDGSGGVNSLDSYDGENGLLARLKLWLSRGTIMEQKLLHTYMHPTEDVQGGGDGTTTAAANTASGRYADNPVLVWTLALMWAFVVLILMHPKIAELVEGGDPGQLADIVEWLFG